VIAGGEGGSVSARGSLDGIRPLPAPTGGSGLGIAPAPTDTSTPASPPKNEQVRSSDLLWGP